MEHVEYAYTQGMADADVEKRLRTAESGVLSLANQNDAYAIPLAHLYDDGRLYFRLGTTAGSKKREFLEATGTACYVLYGAEATDDPRELDSWSVVVTGQLSEVPEAERDRFDTATINHEFTPIRVFDESIEEIDITIFELEIETMTGRSTSSA
ncbi:pyridoxamine 5'-phosphate oxidase family protein [Halolamina rubra]|uniref:pyridoxamine 5'-phosphate oxidase family protein n=1 Tax=Halolamina rubra TaxID=1380430 RepID=UPI0006797604|nr:pyridoxamine 5'-phosphate oxidase family protein [Halolamina rubra]